MGITMEIISIKLVSLFGLILVSYVVIFISTFQHRKTDK